MTSKERNRILEATKYLTADNERKKFVNLIKSLPVDDTPTAREIKNYVDSSPMQCERRKTCEGCGRHWICDNLYCVDDWDLEEISDVIKKGTK